MQRELIPNLDRRKAAIARNPLYVEAHNWQDYLTGVADVKRRSGATTPLGSRRDHDARFED